MPKSINKIIRMNLKSFLFIIRLPLFVIDSYYLFEKIVSFKNTLYFYSTTKKYYFKYIYINVFWMLSLFPEYLQALWL